MSREIGVVEDTLYVPMLGRIYASENCSTILYDQKALELKAKLPEEQVNNHTQTQYTYLASAIRSANMDRYIADFLKRKPDGIIVQLGCGLETTYYRDDHGQTKWYEIDLPDVIEYRKKLLPEQEREEYIAADAFQKQWIEQIRSFNPDRPLLITAGGLFYYFEEGKVLALIHMLQNYGDIELLFDAVNKSGMLMMRKKYMKTVGHEDAKMFFYVDSAEKFASALGSTVKVMAEEKFYSHTKKSGLHLSTKLSMTVSDWLSMLKMIHLELYDESITESE